MNTDNNSHLDLPERIHCKTKIMRFNFYSKESVAPYEVLRELAPRDEIKLRKPSFFDELLELKKEMDEQYRKQLEEFTIGTL